LFVRVEELEVGMEVETEITDSSGRRLVPAGTALTESHLKALRAWGISAVGVRHYGQADDGPRELSKTEVSALETRFRHVDLEHPVGRALLDFCLQRAAQRPEPT
jgi:hypothetical protein